jgi:hypothetical protein
MLSCKESTRLLSQGEDRQFSFGERVALRLHLVICKGCRNAAAQLRFLRSAVRQLSRQE